jgi:hypothetical protein
MFSGIVFALEINSEKKTILAVWAEPVGLTHPRPRPLCTPARPGPSAGAEAAAATQLPRRARPGIPGGPRPYLTPGPPAAASPLTAPSRAAALRTDRTPPPPW